MKIKNAATSTASINQNAAMFDTLSLMHHCLLSMSMYTMQHKVQVLQYLQSSSYLCLQLSTCFPCMPSYSTDMYLSLYHNMHKVHHLHNEDHIPFHCILSMSPPPLNLFFISYIMKQCLRHNLLRYTDSYNCLLYNRCPSLRHSHVYHLRKDNIHCLLLHLHPCFFPPVYLCS